MIDGSEARVNIVGGASIDTLHLAEGSACVAGGAGLYAALAACRAGLEVTMVGPTPNPVPPELTAAARILDWRGAEVAADDLPRFDISYDVEGRRRLEVMSRGAEARLSPQEALALLPPGPVCVVPLTDPQLQLDVVHALKAAGRWVACGTYPCGAKEDGEVVRSVFEASDAFFCNEEEAEILFGSVERASTLTGKLLFVTRGARGARVVQGEYATDVEPVPAVEVDPTGAGDAFCGATLAELARGAHPVEAARRGAAAAAQVVGGVGPAALLEVSSVPAYPEDPRVKIDRQRLETLARWLGSAAEVAGFDFCGESFPDLGDPYALDFFFAQALQQFGFWTADGNRYREPLVAPAGGRLRKGSDYLWFVYRRLLEEDPEALTPARHRALERSELDHWFRSDAGSNPVPASDLHFELAQRYGADLTALGAAPEDLVAEANGSKRPLAALLRSLDHVGGYKEDPLRKKSALLALVLMQRPERFLRPSPEDELPPIVDYHIQRSCLRMGLVQVESDELREQLITRSVLEEADEAAIRAACYEAVWRVQRKSGRSMPAVDWFFFQNRRRCPEMSVPDCPSCEAETVCARRKELFQPVFRTTFY